MGVAQVITRTIASQRTLNIPEPATLPLAGTLLLGLPLARRRNAPPSFS
jgi:hypothetical protein